jgi:ABC transporter DrrB family efflux protein
MFFSALVPIAFVLLFRYVFGGAIYVPGYPHYVDYLIPGIVVQTVLFGGSSTAVGLADDLASGMTDRFRSLPIHRGAILAARTLGDLLRLTYTVGLVIAIGLLVGYRFHSHASSIVAGIAIALLFGYACSWMFALLALSVRHAETAQLAAFLVTFPLAFASSIFASPRTMPTWLRDFANAQPVTEVVDALRQLTHQTSPSPSTIAHAVAWSAGLLIVASVLATRRFQRT